jgi:hypothetical protein
MPCGATPDSGARNAGKPRNAALPRRLKRHSHDSAQRPDWLAGAGGFEPLHFRIGIRQDSQPGRRDSNLCISKSSKTADWTVRWSPQAVQWPYCIIRDAVVRLLPPQPASQFLTHRNRVAMGTVFSIVVMPYLVRLRMRPRRELRLV